MQVSFDHLLPKCDRLDLPFLGLPRAGELRHRPVAHTVTDWLEGERGYPGAVDFLQTESRLEQTVYLTSELPTLAPDFNDEEGKVITSDLGNQASESIQARGVRFILHGGAARAPLALRMRPQIAVWGAAQGLGAHRDARRG